MRRDDFVEVAEKFNVTVTSGYYLRAMEYVRGALEARGERAVFFVASDDPLWFAKKLWGQRDAHLFSEADNDEEEAARDLAMLAQCRHHIIR